MAYALETTGLIKRFGKSRPAVDGVSLHVPSGAIYGFLGANGAGKTTSLRLILGLLRPDEGEIFLFGRALRRGVGGGQAGALIETPSPYPHLTGRENLDLSRRLLRLPRAETDRVLEIVDLRQAADRRAGGYSLGMRQRLGVARALLGNPPLLILDEPTNGLDPDGIRDMRALLRGLSDAGDTTLIVSSHLLSEVEQIASHVGLLHHGRLLLESPLDRLLGGTDAIEVDARDREGAARSLAEAGFALASSEADAPLLVEAGRRGEADPSEIAALLVREGHELVHLARHRPSLERIYHQHIAKAA